VFGLRTELRRHHADSDTDAWSSSGTPEPLKIPRLRFDGVHNARGLDEHVTFSYYKFLRLKELSTVQPGEVRFLEFAGSLHVPMKPVLDEFVQQYFLHVQPHLPLLKEREFWEAYEQSLADTENLVPVSLFLFQAMLFASCAVCTNAAY
jgi:hypothetical protein